MKLLTEQALRKIIADAFEEGFKVGDDTWPVILPQLTFEEYRKDYIEKVMTSEDMYKM